MRKKAVNLTISDEIRARADRTMNARGFSSFSAYVEQLIREEYDRRALPTAPAAVYLPPNSSASPAFQAILADAARVAAGHAEPSAQPAAIQPTTYAPRRQAKPRRPSKLKK